MEKNLPLLWTSAALLERNDHSLESKKGISFMEGSLSWHARPMDKEFYDKAVADLENA